MECYSGVRFHNLEHRNVCTEPERQRNSLGNTLQFPFRRRSTAAKRQCDSRLLQDGLADDGCDPGAHRKRHAHSYAYRQPHTDAYGNIHTDTDPNGNGYCYANSYRDSYSYCYCYADCYCHGDSYPDANTNIDGDTNSTAYTYAQGQPITKGSSHSGAQTLIPVITEKSLVVGCQS